MSHNQNLVETIKKNLARRSTVHLRAIDQANGRGDWSMEATIAARELLGDRLSGREKEPENPEEDYKPDRHYDINEVGLGVLASLMTGTLVIPYFDKVEDSDLPIPFGQNMAWLAVETEDTRGVASALGLTNTHEADWSKGIEKAHAGSIYVTPPLAAWTIAVGSALFPAPGNADRMLDPLLERLSLQFGESQYYCNHSDIELYAWARARNGRILRSFGWLGARRTMIWERGAPTKQEVSLGFQYASGAAPMIQDDESKALTADFLFELASLWSLDPTSLDAEFQFPAPGIVGTMPNPFPA